MRFSTSTETVPTGRRVQTMSLHGVAHVNVGSGERLLSALGGAALTAYGLGRRNLGGIALAILGAGLLERAVTGHCEMYHALGIDTAHQRHGRNTSVRAGAGVKVERTLVVSRPVGEVYRAWRNLENLPQFMRHLDVVHEHGMRSHWVAKGPMGFKAEWDAEIINDHDNELIAWRSVDGGAVETAGSVHFVPLDTGTTEVRVVLKYNPPAGKAGAVIARMFGQAPEQMIDQDLCRFKQWLESGGRAIEA